MKDTTSQAGINRRSFLQSSAAVGASLAFSPYIFTQAASGASSDDLNVALLGAGAQGQALLNACKDIPGIRFKAVCDIWEAYNLKRTSRILQSQGHELKSYIDYQEMLADQKDLDAVIIATPDFWH